MASPKARNSRVPTRADDKEQSKLFIKKAREIGADEKKSRVDELIGQLARKPPQPKPRKKDE